MTKALLTARSVGSVLAFSALPILPSCADDPVHDEEVALLLGELPGVPPGPFHRAGQPCTVCHGGLGPASTQFSMAGTVFNSKTAAIGVDRAQILLVDANGSSPTIPILTNCVGNFFITPDIWSPAFPVLVGIQSGSAKTEMLTQISRAASCAECHTDPQSTAGAGHVFIDVSVDPAEFRACPVSPEVAGDGGIL